MTTKELTDAFKSLPSTGTDSINTLLYAAGDGTLKKASQRSVANLAFMTISNADDLDNPTHKGIYSITKDTPVTRPAKGSGWNYGFVINLAIATGVQLWINYDGYIAVRGKGSSTGPWSEWSVMQRM